MDRETFWNGFYGWFVFQLGFLLVGKFIEDWSWWIVMIPTLLVILVINILAIYFFITCNLRIEKDKNDQ